MWLSYFLLSLLLWFSCPWNTFWLGKKTSKFVHILNSTRPLAVNSWLDGFSRLSKHIKCLLFTSNQLCITWTSQDWFPALTCFNNTDQVISVSVFRREWLWWIILTTAFIWHKSQCVITFVPCVCVFMLSYAVNKQCVSKRVCVFELYVGQKLPGNLCFLLLQSETAWFLCVQVTLVCRPTKKQAH